MASTEISRAVPFPWGTKFGPAIEAFDALPEKNRGDGSPLVFSSER